MLTDIIIVIIISEIKLENAVQIGWKMTVLLSLSIQEVMVMVIMMVLIMQISPTVKKEDFERVKGERL